MNNNTNDTEAIADVSDTALWVAVYRARESERADALFRDPLAHRLIGERGFRIERRMGGSSYTEWSLVMRTVVIDNFIRKLVAEGVKTVINLGAGLDTRPYRLSLPSDLRWIEVDFPHMIELKNSRLAGEHPGCHLERVPMDLTDREQRRLFFAKASATSSGPVLILTEGVTPYLSEEDVGALADDLRAQLNFKFWITDYFSAQVIRYIQSRRKRELKNAPFLFSPADWFGFFKSHGWQKREMRYLAEESDQVGRPFPLPLWARVIRFFVGTRAEVYRKMVAYVVLTPD